MPRISTVNSGFSSISSNILTLKSTLIEPVFFLTANTFILDEGQTAEINFFYRNYNHPSTIYWELVSSSNFNSSDISTEFNGDFLTKSKNNQEKILVTTVADLSYIGEETTETFQIRFRENDVTGNILLTSSEFSVLDTSNTEFVGQVVFTSTASWQVPPFVSSISIVAVGGGGLGAATPSYNPGTPGIPFSYGGGAGGGGGGLAWKNNVPVTAGETLSVVVGGGGQESYVSRGPTKFLRALGGSSASTITGGSGGSFVGDGGGTGGNGRTVASIPATFGTFGGGGGGAGGYSGSGGQGGFIAPAGGGGAGGNDSTSSTAGAGGGGGVGLLGIGSPGTTLRSGGSGGTSGSPSPSFRSGGSGGFYGGGGGGGNAFSPFGNPNSGNGGSGTQGAIRIIYPGQTRQFPTTRTGNE